MEVLAFLVPPALTLGAIGFAFPESDFAWALHGAKLRQESNPA